MGAAWRELSGLLEARPGAFVLYILVKIVVSIVILMLIFLTGTLFTTAGLVSRIAARLRRLQLPRGHRLVAGDLSAEQTLDEMLTIALEAAARI